MAKIVVDGHVHLYDCHDLGVFFDAAAASMAAHVTPSPARCVLLLTETEGDHRFDALAKDAQDGGAVVAGWSIEATHEPESLRFSSGADELFVVAGRQIVTSERLEVVALGTCERFEDGWSLEQAYGAARAAGALAGPMWGFGKWSGARGRLVAKWLDAQDPEGLVVGDNGGCPAFLPEPAIFRWARRQGVPVVAGTDPLPLNSEVGRVGSYAQIFDADFDAARPWSSVRSAMSASPGSVAGRRSAFLPFIRAQLGLRAIKH